MQIAVEGREIQSAFAWLGGCASITFIKTAVSFKLLFIAYFVVGNNKFPDSLLVSLNRKATCTAVYKNKSLSSYDNVFERIGGKNKKI